MRYLKKINYFTILIAVLMLLSACSSRKIVFDVPENIYVQVLQKNQAVCSYKGRITVLYKSENDNVRFKGLLNKDCADNFKLKIFGLFNTIAYDVNYENGEMKAMKNNEDVSLEMSYFMKSRGLDDMVWLIRYPHIRIDNSFKARAVKDEYILSKDDARVAVGQDFLIRRISIGDESFSYEYSDGKLSVLIYKFNDIELEIKLG